MKRLKMMMVLLVIILVMQVSVGASGIQRKHLNGINDLVYRHLYANNDTRYLTKVVDGFKVVEDDYGFLVILYSNSNPLGQLKFRKFENGIYSEFSRELLINVNSAINEYKTQCEDVLGFAHSFTQPERERVLRVRGIAQDGPTCWAATCASIINYVRGTNLDHYDVALNITGDPYVGGSLNDIMRAFRNWDLAPRNERGILNFNDVVNEIERDYPIYARLESNLGNGHGVAIIGYTEWGRDMNYERGYTILEPNGARRVYEIEDRGFSHYVEDEEFKWWDTITVR